MCDHGVAKTPKTQDKIIITIKKLHVLLRLGVKYHYNRIHVKKRTYNCSFCKKSFPRVLLLQVHMVMNHSRDETTASEFAACKRLFPRFPAFPTLKDIEGR